MTMCYGAVTSIIIFVFISSTTVIAHAKIERSFASETQNSVAQQNAVAAEESPLQARSNMDADRISIDNLAEADEHHRIVILVPQLVPPAAAAAYSQRAKKPKKKKPVVPRPQPPKRKPKVHHHPHVVPVVHSGKVIHSHHHHGSVDHGHSHIAKAKHAHKHYGKASHKHGHYGVGRITHKHVATVKPPPPPPPHKPKHPHLTAGVDVFNQNYHNGGAFRNQNSYPNPSLYQQQQQHQQQQQQQQQQHRLRQYPHQYHYNNHPQSPPSHLQHQQQVLHHRAFASAAPNFFNNPVAADPYSFYNGVSGGGGGGIPAPSFGNRGRTANDRRDFLPPNGNLAQLIQIRRIPSPSSKEDQVLDTFIDKNTRSSLAAAALAFGNENENEAEADAVEADDENENETENEKENETENETENENENENEKDDETGYVAGGGGGALERAIEEAAFGAIPRQKTTDNFGRTKRPFGAANTAVPAAVVPSGSEENFAALQLNGIDHGGVHQNEASLHYPTFANPPPPGLSPKSKIIAFSDAYHYQY